MRDVLRHPGMRLLLTGETANMFGDWALILVLGIWTKTLTGSNAMAGVVLLGVAAPQLIGPLFGWVSDRYRRKPFLIVVNLLSALALTPLLVVRDRGDVWIIYVVAAGIGISGSLSGGTFAGLLKELVPDAQLGSANSMFTTIGQMLRLVCPLLGAGLFAATGGATVALIDIISFLIAAAALAAIRHQSDAPVRGELHWLHELSAGVRHVIGTVALRRTTLAVASGMLALGAIETLVYAYIDEGLHRPPAFLSVVVTAQGLGAIAGAAGSAWAMRRFGEVACVAIGLASFGVAVGIAIDSSLLVMFVAMPFAGLGNALSAVAFSTLLQRRTPGPLMARVETATGMIVGTAQTLSMAAGAVLVGIVDYKILFAAISAVLIGSGGWLVVRDPTRSGEAEAAGPGAPVQAGAAASAAGATDDLLADATTSVTTGPASA